MSCSSLTIHDGDVVESLPRLVKRFLILGKNPGSLLARIVILKYSCQIDWESFN